MDSEERDLLEFKGKIASYMLVVAIASTVPNEYYPKEKRRADSAANTKNSRHNNANHDPKLPNPVLSPRTS